MGPWIMRISQLGNVGHKMLHLGATHAFWVKCVNYYFYLCYSFPLKNSMDQGPNSLIFSVQKNNTAMSAKIHFLKFLSNRFVII